MPDNTILVRSATAVREEGFIASEVLTPGELVEFGGSDDIQAHSTAGGTVIGPMFVRAQQENQGADIDTDISSGDEATVIFPQSGDIVLATASAAISANDIVESDGAGRVQTQAADTATDQGERNSVVGQALEAAGAAGDRLKVIIA